MGNVIILRGVQGAGKSTFAELLQQTMPNAVICSADDYFMQDGVYKFYAALLPDAHRYCRLYFLDSIAHKVETIIVDNTNATEKELQWYVDKAKEEGYRVTSLVVENRHGSNSVHNVPEESRKRTADRIKGSLRLV